MDGSGDIKSAEENFFAALRGSKSRGKALKPSSNVDTI